MPEKTLLLLDANSLINRAYYGLLGRQNLTAPDGTPTGALFAFYNMYLLYLDDLKPSHAAAAFDRREPTFRHESFAGYKATRKPMAEELSIQMPMLKELLDMSGVRCIEQAGYEADDLIGTLAAAGEACGYHTYIVSGDKDSFQLASERVTILQPLTRSGRTETERFDPAAICDRYQITPAQMIELKAIVGDPSDNIPGVKGIGEKGAIELITRYGSLDGVYAALGEIRPALAEKLAASREQAYLSRTLSIICKNVPIDTGLDHYILNRPDARRLNPFLSRLGFKTILARLNLAEAETADSKESGESGETRAASRIAREIDLADWQKILDKKPELPGLWLARDCRMTWTDDSGQIYLVPAQESRQAWQALADCSFIPALYDYKSLLRDYKYPYLPAGAHDILIAAYLLNQIEGKPDLARIYERATGHPVPPDLTDGVQAIEEKRGLEAEEPPVLASMACLIRDIAHGQRQEIESRGIQTLVDDIEMPLIPILAGMEQVGFAVDGNALEDLNVEMGKRLDTLQNDIFKLCGRSFNLNSPRQLGEVLYVDLGLSTGKKMSGGSFSTDSDELERLAEVHPAVPLIIEHRQIAKLKSTYVDGLRKVLDPIDGRVHTTFNQVLTSTGRLSSSEPNLQNIPIRMEAGQAIRRAFVAAPGRVLIDADYSQIELRLLAHLSGDPAMIDAFVRAEDIHVNTAMRLFNRRPEEITAKMRSIAKTMNFSIAYGISDFGLSRDLGVSVQQAHHLISEYEAQYPLVRQYLKSLVEAAYQNGYVETMFGRRRYMTELKSPNRNLRQFGERAAMNMPIQGTEADLIKLAMVRVGRRLREEGLDARLILQVHDELIVEAPVKEAVLAAKLLKESMENVASLKVPIIVEVCQGTNWGECK